MLASAAMHSKLAVLGAYGFMPLPSVVAESIVLKDVVLHQVNPNAAPPVSAVEMPIISERCNLTIFSEPVTDALLNFKLLHESVERSSVPPAIFTQRYNSKTRIQPKEIWSLLV